jgi:hypothetical protein
MSDAPRPMTAEQFEELLWEILDAAALAEPLADSEVPRGPIEDARNLSYTAEVALGLLNKEFTPKSEAVLWVREIAERRWGVPDPEHEASHQLELEQWRDAEEEDF